MATIQEAYEYWLELSTKFDTVIDDSIKDNEELIIKEQVDQMRHGQDAEGNVIGIYRSWAYALFKEEMGLQEPAPSGVVNLYLTGDFTRGIELQYSKDFVMPNSTDKKNNMLIEKYGDKIFGLMPERLGKVSQENILPDLLKRCKEILKLND